MFKKLTFATLVAALFSLTAPIDSWACDWCVTVNDACCDGNFSSVDYTTTCDATSVWVYYDISSSNRVEIYLYEVTNGNEVLLAHINDSEQDCDCVKKKIYDNVNSGHQLRFKVNCRACNTNCATQTATVKFFTPSSNLCAPNCSGS